VLDWGRLLYREHSVVGKVVGKVVMTMVVTAAPMILVVVILNK